MLGGTTVQNYQDESQTLIPVQLDEHSPIEFISQEAIKIISDENKRLAKHFGTLNDDEKEQYLSNLLIDHAKKDKSILDREIVQCTLNKGIYNLLTTFYVPDNVAKTAASWIAWFLRGLGSITWTFIKTTVLYMLTNWQRTLMLVYLDFVVLYNFDLAYIEALELEAFLAAGDLTPANAIIKAAVVIAGYTGASAVNLLFITSWTLEIFLWYQLGSYVINYIIELKNSMAEINANCVLSTTPEIQTSPKTKQQIQKQVEEALQNISQTSAVKKGIQQSRSLKNKSPKAFEKEFVDHVQNAVETTPVHEITTLVQVPQPEKITPDQYIASLVKFSTNLANTVTADTNTSVRLEPSPIPNLNVLEGEQPNQFSIQLDSLGSFNSIASPEPEYQIQDPIVQNVSKQLIDQFSIVLGEL